ncbi:MAG: peptidoglycan glycosyltransferase [Cyanobium sp. SAT1300]|nr:peptidoglycan glycosyltransferase [Cyanobium sp. SAT1300]|tara:strand:+ start:3682 stop:5805 length:2124 start_codon:yes stop_codon:yes gene_type:complete
MVNPTLLVQQLNQSERSIELHGDSYQLGRDNNADIPLIHPAISRLHARLVRCGRHWRLIDEQSTNGLWWQGRRIQEIELRDGDQIALAPASEPDAPQLIFRNPSDQNRRSRVNLIGLVIAITLTAGSGLLVVANLSVPVRGRLARVQGPIALYDRNDRPISSVDSERHNELKGLDSFSPLLINAVIASEDSRFWWHPGIDAIGTLRALVTNVQGQEVLEGGSSLTQQLARSLYPDQVGQGDTLERKWRELLVALQLESRFSKSDLLLSYLNRVYLGVGYGFEDAAQAYFDTSAGSLRLDQAALLVGLLPSPNGHDPCRHPARALQARNLVLNKMADQGTISLDTARLTRRRPIQLTPDACDRRHTDAAPFYSDQVQRDLAALVGTDVAAEGNFLIETYYEPRLQAVIQHQLRRALRVHSGRGIEQGAAVLIDSRSGGVLAISGGRDFRSSQFNRASMALRQPGSTFKLFSYLAALEQNISPDQPFNCGPLHWGGQQFDSDCAGQRNLIQAFALSDNTVALRLAQRIGIDQVVRQARALGITTPLSPVPGLTLGQSEVRLIELTSAYAAVENDGLWSPATTIRRLVDAETCASETTNRCRSRSTPVTTSRQAIRADTALKMQKMLRAVVQKGTGQAAALGGNEGGKTGTTNEGRDLLFIGYEPTNHWVLGIWLGNDDNTPTTGSSAIAAGLWGDIIRAAQGGGSQSKQ